MTTPTVVNAALPEVIEKFREVAKSKGLPDYYIGIDIGGTNTRVNAGFKEGEIYEFAKFLASDVQTLYTGLLLAETILRSIYVDKAPLACCIDIAGPTTTTDNYRITNYTHDENGSILQRKMLPTLICPPKETYFLNDLESGCYGLVSLIHQNQNNQYFTSVVNRVQPKTPGAQIYVVLAAGTGLGAGLIYHIDNHNKYYVIPTELGHISIKPFGPNHSQHKAEYDLLKNIEPNYEKNVSATEKRKFALEYEDIVSGRGLVDCYNYFKSPQDKDVTDSGEVAMGAINEIGQSNRQNSPYTKALLAHYRYLFREAQELAVGLRATDVFLIGDNIVSNAPFVESVKAELVDEFFNHPKDSWLKNVTSLHVQSKKENLNLLGTIYYARNVLDQ